MLECILSEVNAVDVRVEHFRLFVFEVNWLFRISCEPFGLSRGTKEARSLGEDGSVQREGFRSYGNIEGRVETVSEQCEQTSVDQVSGK